MLRLGTKKCIHYSPDILPYPPVGGDKLKNYNLLKILSKHYEVHLVTVTNEKLDDKTREVLKQYTTSYKVFEKSKIDFIFSTLKLFINKEPLQVNYYYFQDVQKYINKMSHDVDLIISTLIRTSKYAININVPKIFDMADSIGLNYKNSIANVKSFFWKFIYKFEYTRLISYEQKCINAYDITFMFNRKEIKFFKNPKITFMPYSANNDEVLSYTKTNNTYKNYICFLGKMDYQPNIDAALWFINNVLQNINNELTFVIVGAYPAKELKVLDKVYDNLVITGFVEDPYEILNSALCVVAPMQTDGGIQGKVLETMALGTINIITSLAAKPIGAISNKDYIVEDGDVLHIRHGS